MTLESNPVRQELPGLAVERCPDAACSQVSGTVGLCSSRTMLCLKTASTKFASRGYLPAHHSLQVSECSLVMQS